LLYLKSKQIEQDCAGKSIEEIAEVFAALILDDDDASKYFEEIETVTIDLESEMVEASSQASREEEKSKSQDGIENAVGVESKNLWLRPTFLKANPGDLSGYEEMFSRKDLEIIRQKSSEGKMEQKCLEFWERG
jgi:hypothetical protein